MAAGIYNHLLSYKLRIFSFCDKLSIGSQVSPLFDLSCQECNRLINLFTHGTFKYHILDDIHLSSCFLFSSLITNKAHAGSRQKILWLLTEQEKCDYCWM